LAWTIEYTDTAKGQLRKLDKQTAHRILRAAFVGELEPHDPNDEPASVLLERIRAERAAQVAGKKSLGRKTTSRIKSE
jgi:type I restriction enzyme, S subunit